MTHGNHGCRTVLQLYSLYIAICIQVFLYCVYTNVFLYISEVWMYIYITRQVKLACYSLSQLFVYAICDIFHNYACCVVIIIPCLHTSTCWNAREHQVPMVVLNWTRSYYFFEGRLIIGPGQS